MRDLVWTPAKIQRLRELWTAGVSTQAIGLKLRLSKNAVCGKAGRLGLPAREPGFWSTGEFVLRRDSAKVRLPQLWASSLSMAEIERVTGLREPTLRRLAADLELCDRPQKLVVPAPYASAARIAPIPPLAAPPVAMVRPPRDKPAPNRVVSPAKRPDPQAPRLVVPARPTVPAKLLFDGGGEPGAPGCRFPLGDPKTPGFRYCGAGRPHGRSYCDKHHAIACIPVRKPTQGDGRVLSDYWVTRLG